MHPWASPRLVEAQGRGRQGGFSLGASLFTAKVGSIGVNELGRGSTGRLGLGGSILTWGPKLHIPGHLLC